MDQSLMLGTRGSALALAQTQLVRQALAAAGSRLQVEIKKITTAGDRRKTFSNLRLSGAGVKGLFTKELEQALANREIDVAVHSAKDLPGQPANGLTIATVLPRADPGDVLISKVAHSVAHLPVHARIATSSVRRRRQLLWLRPDFVIEEMRGNVPTRIEKLRSSATLDAIVLARAGIERLQLDLRDLHVSDLEILPAAGQGIIALQTRADDETTIKLLEPINHEPTFIQLRGEREFLRLLEGDCDLPVGVESVVSGSRLRMKAIIFDDDDAAPRTAESEGNTKCPEAVAAELFEELK